MSDFKTKIFPEPELEFGDQHHHPDPRLGLLQAGPLQTNLGDTIKVGVVGSALTVEKSGEFLNAIEDGFEGKTERHPNLHPDFPGLRNQNPYRCRFEMVAAEDGVLTKGQIEKIAKEPSDVRAVEMAVDAVMAQLEKLEAHHERPDVVMVSLPVKLIERVWRNERARDDEIIEDEAADAKAGKETSPNFRGLLKARAMDLRFSIQIVWEDVINPDAKIPRKIKENSDRQTQDRLGSAFSRMPKPTRYGPALHKCSMSAAEGSFLEVALRSQSRGVDTRFSLSMRLTSSLRTPWPPTSRSIERCRHA